MSEMSEENFLQRAKRLRDEADLKTIREVCAAIPEEITIAVSERKDKLRFSTTGEVMKILFMEKSPAKDDFYAQMAKLGFERHAIRLECYDERPPYSYTIILDLGE